MCPHPIYRVFLQVRVITALSPLSPRTYKWSKKGKCTFMLFSKFQQSWKTKLNISKSTTDPGIECLIECFNSIHNFRSNFSFTHNFTNIFKKKTMFEPFVNCYTFNTSVEILAKLQFGLVWQRERNTCNNLTNTCNNFDKNIFDFDKYWRREE